MALEPRKVAEVRQLCHPCAGAMLCEAHPSTPQTLAFQQLYTLEVRVLHESHSPPPHFEVQLPKNFWRNSTGKSCKSTHQVSPETSLQLPSALSSYSAGGRPSQSWRSAKTGWACQLHFWPVNFWFPRIAHPSTLRKTKAKNLTFWYLWHSTGE